MFLIKKLREAWKGFTKANISELPCVIYICDRGACENCSYPTCEHTMDITHAANFINDCGVWVEKED